MSSKEEQTPLVAINNTPPQPQKPAWLTIILVALVAGAVGAVVSGSKLFPMLRHHGKLSTTPIDPVSWGKDHFGFHQGEVLEGIPNRFLFVSGQTALQADGISVVAEGDMKGQIQQTLKNIDEILKEASMDRSNLVMIHSYTTDVDSFFQNYDVVLKWLEEAGDDGVKPPHTLLGVSRLAYPDLLVEIEVQAAA